jgi:hypothetical protein
MDISFIGNSLLRLAIQRNLASFPSQVPSLNGRHAGRLQPYIAQLYFGRGWSVREICLRYGMRKTSVQVILTDWRVRLTDRRVRAVASGYIQVIDPIGLQLLLAETKQPPRKQQILPVSHPAAAGAELCREPLA